VTPYLSHPGAICRVMSWSGAIASSSTGRGGRRPSRPRASISEADKAAAELKKKRKQSGGSDIASPEGAERKPSVAGSKGSGSKPFCVITVTLALFCVFYNVMAMDSYG